MIDRQLVESLAERLRQHLPESVEAARADAGDNLKSVLHAALERMDIVSREEFELQRAMLDKLRARADALAARLDALEAADEPRTGEQP